MFKAIDKWLPGYIASRLTRPPYPDGTRHLFFCVADHFEPFRGTADPATALGLVKDWVAAYPASVSGFRDHDGCPPRHTFFYPQEEYDAGVLETLAGACREGIGEVEIHLHHRHDTPERLHEKLVAFRDTLHSRHGLLGREQAAHGPGAGGAGDRNGGFAGANAVRYGFIHGNWALCNSRPDGDWCGVNEELGVLAATGCYADFTFPSAPSPTQARLVNAVYRATDRAGRPRGADRGVRVRAGAGSHRSPDLAPSSLMLIQGPLALNWRRRKWGVLPRLENAEITAANPPTRDRVGLWVDQRIGVGGRPDWVFVKVHTHGCVPCNRDTVLGPAMRDLHGALQREFNDGSAWQLHYVTARELYNLARAAEGGWTGTPAEARDHEIGRPPACDR